MALNRAQERIPLFKRMQIPRVGGPLPATRWWHNPLQWLIIAGIGFVLGAYVLGLVLFVPEFWWPYFLLVVLCPFVILIFGDARRFFLIGALVTIPFQLGGYFGYVDEQGDVGAFSGFNVTLMTLSLVALYALWFARATTGIGRPKIHVPVGKTLLAIVPATLFILATAFSLPYAADLELALFEFTFVIQVYFLFVYMAGTVRSREDVLFILLILFAAAVAQATWMLIVGLGVGVGGSTDTAEGVSRLGGGSQFFGSPNVAGAYLSMLLAPAAALLFSRTTRLYGWVSIAVLAICGVALLLTFSRGGWIAFILSTLILFLVAGWRGWMSLKVPLGLMAAGIILIIPLSEMVMTRIDDSGAALSRVPLMELSFRIIADYPVFGAGMNNFTAIMQNYLTPEFANEWIYVVHNKYLLVWAETGTLGIVTYLLFLSVTLYRGWCAWLKHNRLLALIALGCSAAILGHMTHMLFDIFNAGPPVQTLWLYAGLITAIDLIPAEERV